DLLQEEVGGDRGRKGPLAERAAQVAADPQGEGFGDDLGQVALEVVQGLRDSGHGDLLCVGVTFPSPSSQEVAAFPSLAETLVPQRPAAILKAFPPGTFIGGACDRSAKP